MPIDAVLFDCDGTLVESETLASEILVASLAELGLALSAEDVARRFTGRRMAHTVTELERELGRALPPTFVVDVRSRMDAAFEARLRPVDGAAELLRSISLPVCVATGGPRSKAERNLERTGLLAFFAGRIYSSYDVGSWKPDPGLHLHAAAALGVAPARCGVVEDSLPGVQAASAAGMRVFVRRSPAVDGAALGADVTVFGALTELVPLLGAAR